MYFIINKIRWLEEISLPSYSSSRPSSSQFCPLVTPNLTPSLVTAPSPLVWNSFTPTNQISVGWTAVPGASSYVVKWKDVNAATYTSGSLSVTTYLVQCAAKDGSAMLVSYQYQTATDSSAFSVPITFLCASSMSHPLYVP